MRSFLLAIAAGILLIPAGMSAASNPSNADKAKINTAKTINACAPAARQDTSFAFLKTPTQRDLQLKSSQVEAICILYCPFTHSYIPCYGGICKPPQP